MWKPKEGSWEEWAALLRKKNGTPDRRQQTGIRYSTRFRRAKVVDALAKACVLRDPVAYRHPQSLREFWDDSPPPTRYEIRIVGGMHAAKRRASEPSFTTGQTSPLNVEFTYGLKLAGALTRSDTDPYRCYIARHIADEFVADVGALGIPFRATTVRSKYTRISRCPLLMWMSCCNGKSTASIVAGLLAGAEVVRVRCEAWLEVPNNELTTHYLDAFTISYERVRAGRKLRLSPYYGALLSGYMPDRLASRLLSINKPVGGCPLLPCVYYDWTSGTRSYDRTLPAATALPFGCAYASFFNNGFSKDSLVQRGRDELHIYGVGGELLRITKDWVHAYFDLRGNGEVPLRQIRDCLKDKCFPVPASAVPVATSATITS